MDTHNPKPNRRRAIAWPTAHLLALAPIDVWVRMLIKSRGVKPRYLGRLAFILITSLVGTACTVHERVILSVIRQRRFRAEPRIERQTIVILGYYRSGTTHLHNLMSCDDRLITPRWYQCLAGQGFVAGWSILRFVLVPFLGSTRPQDSVGFGPNWPAEDDFAMSSWGMCSSIPGRFIWPSQWDDWKRWHTLEDLSDKELHRWRSLMAMFVWKLTRGKRNRSKIVLLKTPSHTARVAELDRLFGGNVKFIHLVREPVAVIDSNVRLHLSLAGHLLEDAPDVQTIRNRIVDEYAYTETKCCEQLDAIDKNRWVRVRYQDLRNDPIQTLEHIASSIGHPSNAQSTQAYTTYLSELGNYSSTKHPIPLGESTTQHEQLANEMRSRYELDAPPLARVQIASAPQTKPNFIQGLLAAIGIAIACIALWIGLVLAIHTLWPSFHPRLIPAAWICGPLIGLGVRRASANGSRSLGILAAVMTLLVVLAVGFPISVINFNFASEPYNTTNEWLIHNSKYAYQGLKSVSSLVYITLGMMTAYRHGSQSGVRAPA